MSALLALLVTMVIAGVVVITTLCVVAVALKFALHVALLPIKLLLIPFVALFAIVKLGIVLAVVTVSIALLIPLVVIIGLIAAPFALISAIL